MNAVALLKDGRLDIWTGTQVPMFIVRGAAKLTGLDPANMDARVALGELFLAKYNGSEAQQTFDEAFVGVRGGVLQEGVDLLNRGWKPGEIQGDAADERPPVGLGGTGQARGREALVDEYVELRARFERSLVEIRVLKRELRQTQSALDGYEVAQVALKQQWQAKEADYTSQLSLMVARVQDLTTKMAAADKQVSDSFALA